MSRTLRHFPRTSLLATIISLLIMISSMPDGYARTTYLAGGEIDQLSKAEGGFSYSINYSFFPFQGSDPERISLIAADGTQLEPTSSKYFFTLSDLSLADLQSKVTGTWTFIEEKPTSEIFHYEFTLPDISSDNFPEIPVITSPSEGAVVTSPFNLEWILPSGNQPRGLLSRRSFGTYSSIDLTGRGSATVSFELPQGITEQSISLEIGQAPGDNSLPFAVTPVTPGADSRFETRFLSVHSLTAPLNLIARVPEPTSLALALGMVTLLCSRRSQMEIL